MSLITPRRIDRYISLAFVGRLVGCLTVLGGLYMVFDLLKNMDEAREAGLKAVLAYYGHLLPLFLLDIVPGLVLVSAGMVLVHMARARELLALKASGISVYRALAPIFLCALATSVVVFSVREKIGPDFAREKNLLDRVIEGKVERQILVRDEKFRAAVFVGEYHFSRKRDPSLHNMKFVLVLQSSPEGILKATIQADSATWLSDGALSLEKVLVQEYDAEGTRISKEVLPSKRVETGLTPFDFVDAAEEEDDPSAVLLTLKGLRKQMGRFPAIPYFRVLFHCRLAAFFSPLILLLLGIPCLIGFERSVNNLFLGTIVCITVAGGYYALTFICTSMGNSGALNALLAGWLPVALVGSAAAWLFRSMLT